MKKTLTVVALLLAMLLVLTSCGGGTPSIEGTWELVDAKSDNAENAESIASAMAMLKEMGGSMTLTFKDGKMTMNMEVMGESQSNELTYEYKDGKLTTDDGTVLDAKIDGNTLTLSGEGNSLTLKKK